MISVEQREKIRRAYFIEKPHLLPLPERDLDCCVTRAVTLKGVSVSGGHPAPG
jgi:hypothetical protein